MLRAMSSRPAKSTSLIPGNPRARTVLRNERTAPVTAFSLRGQVPKTCCIPRNPRGGR
jgi:hypothetical protein